MKRFRWLGLTLAFLLLLVIVMPVFAQTYYFQVLEENVLFTIRDDGTASIDYYWKFSNDSSASPIDYVDVGLPNSNYELSSITGSVDGITVNDISNYDNPTTNTSGISMYLGSNAIPAGQTGEVRLHVETIRDMFFKTDKVPNKTEPYAHFQFRPSWFGSEYMYGNTNMTVTILFPLAMNGTEPVYDTPDGWPGIAQPIEGVDPQTGRVYYKWDATNATGHDQYTFGAAFPARYIPDSSAQTAPLVNVRINFATLCPFIICIGVLGFVIFIIIVSAKNAQKRKLQYLPPRIAIEGQGIKRGLTSIEAAILMEQPMDKILTMILFSSIKKGAAEVVTKEPLQLKLTDPLPEGLNPYEIEFLRAFQKPLPAEKRLGLQEMMVNLVKSVSEKMKGFSRKETIVFYEDIIKRAWEQVEQAETPEVKSQKYDEVMDWTMLDKQYDQRTSQTFGTSPVFLPMWWGRYDPTYRTAGGGIAQSVSKPSLTTGKPSLSTNMPRLPGSDFAASMVNGVQNMSAGVLGGLSSFTSNVTNKTNPIPLPPTTITRSGGGFSGGGGGHSCACACACAGCACACAGGGR